jgi:hypothetical protein
MIIQISSDGAVRVGREARSSSSSLHTRAYRGQRQRMNGLFRHPVKQITLLSSLGPNTDGGLLDVAVLLVHPHLVYEPSAVATATPVRWPRARLGERRAVV